MKDPQRQNTVEYIEIPRQHSSLTRIDTILEQRLRTFIKARRIKRLGGLLAILGE